MTSVSLSTRGQVRTFQTVDFGPRAANRTVWPVTRQEEKLPASCLLQLYSIGSDREKVVGEKYITSKDQKHQ
jgi:hypothetical protein